MTSLEIQEDLEVDLITMVAAECRKAYEGLKVPCIVEHAGLVFADYADSGYPGGLTKPMWNTLGDNFLTETSSSGRPAIARAAVAYCDGSSIHTFLGETSGTLTDHLRGDRRFYWDTAFVPDESNPDGLTYAEIVARPDLGLRHKVGISQSMKAMTEFFEYRLTHEPPLWVFRR